MGIATLQAKARSPELFNRVSLAVWFGLVAGFGEVALLGVQKYALHQATLLGRHVIWMSPLSNLMIFLLLAGVAHLAGRFWKPLKTLPGLFGALSFFALTSWLLMIPRLQTHAVVALALGMAWRFKRLATAREQALQSIVNRTAKWAIAALILVAAASLTRDVIAERRASAHPQRASKPNVLLIVLDTVRAQSLSVYGYARRTSPNLERLARKGALFEQAISTAPWTITSHAGMFTGRLPHELSADWDLPLDGKFPTLAESLRAQGYATAGFVGNTIACHTGSGLSRGFAHYEDFTVGPEEFLISSSLSREVIHSDPLRRWLGYHQIAARKSAAQVNGDFLKWLDGRDARPFFAFLNYFDAHEPYLPPPPFDRKFGSPAARQGRVTHRLRLAWRSDREQISPEENRSELVAYDGALAYLDAQVGALLDELERRGVMQNTLVVITADHGEAFGEHGHYTHGDSLYLTLLRVPLLIVYPIKVPTGKRIAEPVSLRDLPATVMDALKLKSAGSFPGRSLARFWEGPDHNPSTELLFSEVNVGPLFPHKFPPGAKAPMKSLITGRYHYIKNYDGREEVYDFVNDPLELNNLSGFALEGGLIETMRKSLAP